MKRRRFLGGLLAMSMITASFTSTVTAWAKEELPAYKDSSKGVEERVSDLLSRMTLEEKVGQMVQAERLVATSTDVTTYALGSVLSGGGSCPVDNTVSGWATMVKGYQDAAAKTRLGIPIIYGVDAVHGHNNLKGATIMPHNIGLGAALVGNGDAELADIEEAAYITAKEVRATGINWAFAPMIGMPNDVRWGRSYEGFSVDPELVTKAGVATVKGLQGRADLSDLAAHDRVSTSAKHYLGEGVTVGGKNQGDVPYAYGSPEFQAMLPTLLQPYRAAIDAGARTVMPSFNTIGGLKCTGNKELIDVLKLPKDQVDAYGNPGLGFTGFVITDWEAVKQLPGSYKQQVAMTVNAGCDMLMEPNTWKTTITTVLNNVNDQTIPMTRIDDAVTRILRVKFEQGLFDGNTQPYGTAADVRSPEHIAVAEKLARDSLVLLKNDNYNGTPIMSQLNDMEKVFVGGRAADNIGIQCGGWTVTWQGSSGAITPGSTILSGIKKNKGDQNVTYNAGAIGGEKSDVQVICVGELPYAEGNGDRTTLTLDATDRTTIAAAKSAGKPIVLVLITGRPMDITNYVMDDSIAAIVAGWWPGSEGGNAIADVLFGDSDFTGKLSYGWQFNSTQFPIDADKAKNSDELLFNFGYGLNKATVTPDPPEAPPAPPVKVHGPISNATTSYFKIEAEESADVTWFSMARGVQKETGGNKSGGASYGYIDGGERFDYLVNVKHSGVYEFRFRVANGGSAAARDAIGISVNGIMSGTVDVPATGGWDNWRDSVAIQLYIEEGEQPVTVYAAKGGFNFDYVEVKYVGDEPAYSSSPVTITDGGVINSTINYTSSKGLGIGGRPGSGSLVASTNDAYINYLWDIAEEGDYYIDFLASSGSNIPKSIQLRTGQDVIGRIPVTLVGNSVGTGNFTRQEWIRMPAHLPQGQIPMTFMFYGGEFYIKDVRFTKVDTITQPLPRIEGEKYIEMAGEGTIIEASETASNNAILGYFSNSDSARYSINTGNATAFDLAIRYCANSGTSVKISADNGDSKTIDLPKTNGTGNWWLGYDVLSVPDFKFSKADENKLTVEVVSGDLNIDYIDFTPKTPSKPTLPPTNVPGVEGSKGVKLDLPINVQSFPVGNYRVISGVIRIPEGIDVKNVTQNAIGIPADAFDWHLDPVTRILRFAYINTTAEPIHVTAPTESENKVNLDFITINTEIAADFEQETTLALQVDNLSATGSDPESGEIVVDTTEDIVVEIVPPVLPTVATAEIYAGDAVDLIPANQKAVSFTFTNVKENSNILFGDTQLYYSPEKSRKNAGMVYVALVSSDTAIENITASDLTITNSDMQSIFFGNTHSGETVNAQDALNIVSAWLRKGDPLTSKDILIMNVTADGRIDTSDAIAVMDKFLSGKDFAVIVK